MKLPAGRHRASLPFSLRPKQFYQARLIGRRGYLGKPVACVTGDDAIFWTHMVIKSRLLKSRWADLMRSCSKARRALRPILRLALGAAALGLAAAPASALPQCGGASWYQHQGRTASGEINNPDQLTAAHRKLPFGTQVRVSNLSNGKSVVVRINDRGPFISGRVIDVSRAAAAKLGIQRRGVGRVRITAADQKDRGCS